MSVHAAPLFKQTTLLANPKQVDYLMETAALFILIVVHGVASVTKWAAIW